MSMRMVISRILCLLLLALFSAASSAGSINVTYYHNDATGSPVAATNATGEVTWRKSYTPYGQASGKDGNNRRGYTGHVEEANGLVYAGARYYNPDWGRFLSVDPVGFSTGNPMSFNRYAYANNNPYKFVDPDGREIAIAADLCSRNPGAFQQSTSQALTQIYLSSSGAAALFDLTISKNTVRIEPSTNGKNQTLADNINATNGIGSGSTISFNPGKDSTGFGERPPFVGLAHEIGHASAADQGAQSTIKGDPSIFGSIPPSEKQSMQLEKSVQKEHGIDPYRKSYY